MKPVKKLHEKINLTHNTGKPFPHDHQTEKCVLGALLMESDAIYQVSGFLRSKHFYNDKYAKIYGVMLEIFRSGSKIDLITVAQRCKKMKVDATPYDISELTNGIYSANHIAEHAKLVFDMWGQRELMRIGNRMLYIASMPYGDVNELLAGAGSDLMTLQNEFTPDNEQSTGDVIEDIMDEALNPKGGILGLSTGIPLLDNLSDGMEKGDFIIIGARPGMGKTAMLVTMAQSLALDQNTPIAFFSYEMTKKKIYTRIACMRSQINTRNIGKKPLSQGEIDVFSNQMNQLYDCSNFHFVNGRGLDAFGIRSKCVILKRECNIQAVFIDYLQRIPLMKTSRRMSTHEAIGATTQTLAELALELDLPVIVPCQLNRKSTEGNARPTLASLRDSGKIEDDAVKVWFIHRPEYYGQEQFDNGDPTNGKAQIFQEKNRNGETGVTTINFTPEYTKFWSGVVHDDTQDIDVPF